MLQETLIFRIKRELEAVLDELVSERKDINVLRKATREFQEQYPQFMFWAPVKDVEEGGLVVLICSRLASEGVREQIVVPLSTEQLRDDGWG